MITKTQTAEGEEVKPKIKAVLTDQIKSYWFLTFKHSSIRAVFDAMYVVLENGKKRKCYKTGFVENNLTEKGFAYILMSDGSLLTEGNTITLALHNLPKDEIDEFNEATNVKFNLHGKVYPDRSKAVVKYFVQYPVQDRVVLRRIGKEHFLPCFEYKIVK